MSISIGSICEDIETDCLATTQPWAKSISLHQTFLTFSSAHKNAPTAPHRSKIQRNAFILGLPDELLLAVFELAITLNPSPSRPSRDCETLYDYAGIKSLLFTCHQFSRIGLPLLYRIIRFNYPQRTVPPTKVVKSLHRSLQKNPSLLQHCRVLGIYIDDYMPEATPEGFSIANDFVSWFTRVRCLEIYGGFAKNGNAQTWPCIQTAVQHMGEIEHLSISGDYVDLGSIMQNIDIPTLRKLHIYGLSDASQRSTVLQPKKHRIGSFSTLSLFNYQGSHEATVLLIQWPKELSHFHFGWLSNDSFYMDLPMFHSMLLTHKDTLKTVDIWYLSPRGRGRLFVASDFPRLEVLRLSRWQMEKNLNFSSEQADALLAPNLETFGWDFRVYDQQHTESWTDFGSKEEDWLRGLAKAAIARKAALKRIEITYYPDPGNTKEEYGYPWDRMDRIRDEIQPFGITLEYSEPPISKERWLEEVAPKPVFKGRRITHYFFPVRRY